MNIYEEMLLKQYNKLEEEKRSLERAILELETNEKAKEEAKLNRIKGQEAKQKQMKDLLAVYRLSGISVKEVNGSKITLLFDTAYKDRYFESYQVEVETAKEPAVIRHTLPYFVPVTSVAQQYSLDCELNLFANAIHIFLYAYVRRRQQMSETKDRFNQYFGNTFEHTFACDYARIDFTFRCSTFVSVILHYGLEDDLPQTVEVYLKSSDNALKSWCENNFKTKYLENATQILVDRFE